MEKTKKSVKIIANERGYSFLLPLLIFTLGLGLFLASNRFSSSASESFSIPRVYAESQALSATVSPFTMVYDSDKTGRHEIYRIDLLTNVPVQLTDDKDTGTENFWGRISPDRTKVLFYKAPLGMTEQYEHVSLWLMNIDGTNKQEIRPKGKDGWTIQGHAEWSKDGTKLVMFGGQNTAQIFITDLAGNITKQVTNRVGFNLDPSFSPDGSKITFIGCPTSNCSNINFEVYTISVNGSNLKRLTTNNLTENDPYYSYSGTKIAWIQQTNPASNYGLGAWNIWTMNASNGLSKRNVTNDSQINSRPEWSRDDQFIFFHRLQLGAFDKFRIFRINASNGTGLTQILGEPGVVFEYPSL